MGGLFDKQLPPKRQTVIVLGLRAGLLLAGLSTFAAQADVGPALSGLTARASNASTVFSSPAGITRLDEPELLVQVSLVGSAAKFEVDDSNIDGGSAITTPGFLPFRGFIMRTRSMTAGLSVPV